MAAVVAAAKMWKNQNIVGHSLLIIPILCNDTSGLQLKVTQSVLFHHTLQHLASHIVMLLAPNAIKILEINVACVIVYVVKTWSTLLIDTFYHIAIFWNYIDIVFVISYYTLDKSQMEGLPPQKVFCSCSGNHSCKLIFLGFHGFEKMAYQQKKIKTYVFIYAYMNCGFTVSSYFLQPIYNQGCH